MKTARPGADDGEAGGGHKGFIILVCAPFEFLM